jgi:predicted component of type VI protein secretion system
VDIEVGKLRMRLLLVGDRGGTGSGLPVGRTRSYGYLALARIGNARRTRTVVLDKDFIPPCLDCKATILADSVNGF